MSEIVLIFGKRGTGKTASNTNFALANLLDHNNYLQSKEMCESLFGENFNIPFEHTVYSNYRMSSPYGYPTYPVDPFKMVLPNQGLEYEIYVPFASFHIQEGQIYWNSKKKLNRAISGFFENSRHAHFNIYIDVQRPMNIHKDIRELVDRFITVLSIEHTRNKQGKILKTVWHCLEFEDNVIVEKFLDSGDKTLGTKTSYEFIGNIFNYYNSFDNIKLFYPDGELPKFYSWSEFEINPTPPYNYYIGDK